MHMKKCITIHLLLGNIRPRIRYCKMQIFGASRGQAPWTSTRTTMEQMGACGARIYSNVLRNDRRSLHVVSTTCYAFQTKRQKKYDLGGATNRAASPAASLPPRHDASWPMLFYISYKESHTEGGLGCRKRWKQDVFQNTLFGVLSLKWHTLEAQENEENIGITFL